MNVARGRTQVMRQAVVRRWSPDPKAGGGARPLRAVGPATPARARPTVAVVDDEPDIVSTLAFLLRTQGYEVSEYTSSSDFLASLDRRQPDAVVLDLLMPSPDGFATMRQLRDRGFGHIAVIVMTGSGKDAARHAIDEGAMAGFAKPFDPVELLHELAGVIGR